MLVINGERDGSRRFREAFAAFIGRPEPDVFGPMRDEGGSST